MKVKENKVDAYMTLEASYIVPMVYICFLIVIYFTFYLYNMCVIKQGCYLAALRGQELRGVSSAAIKEYVDTQIKMLLDEQVFQYQLEYDVDVNISKIAVTSHSNIENKLNKFQLYDGELQNSGNVSILRLNPTEFVRQNHRW